MKDDSGRRHGGRVLPRAIGIIVVVALAAGCAAAEDADAGDQAIEVEQPRPTAAPAAAASAEPTTTQPEAEATPEPLTLDSQLTPTRLGPIVLGMNVEDAERAGGVTIQLGEDFGGCQDAIVEEFSDSGSGPHPWYDPPVSFLVRDGDIFRIDVRADGITTPEGIGVGSTEEEVYEAYPRQVATTVDRVRQRLLIYIPPDSAHSFGDPPAFLHYTVIAFLSDGHQVTGMRLGKYDAAVVADEGCH